MKERPKLKNLFHLLVVFAVAIMLLPAKPVYADADPVNGFVMDAETLPDGSIGVLFVRGGSASDGVVSGGTLWYGVFNPDGALRWSEKAVGSETGAKEAALAIYDGKAHIAYTTDNNTIAYTYQTDNGWSEPTEFGSNNVYSGGGTVSAPDIVIGSDGTVHIAYFDTEGVESDDGQGYPEVMNAVVGDTVVKSVVFVGWGWFSSPDGNRNFPTTPVKIVQTAADYVNVYSTTLWEKYYGGSDTSYYVDFTPIGGETKEICDDWKKYDIYEACSNGSDVYALGYGLGNYAILVYNGSGATVMGLKSDAVGNYAADLTLDDSGNIYYSAASGSSILFYQNGAAIVKTLQNAINHKKLTTVLSDSIQYSVFTNADGNIVVAYLDDGELVELLPTGLIPEDVSSVTFTATGYDSGVIGGVTEGGEYVISYPAENGDAEETITVPEGEDVIEVTGLVPGTVSVVKKASSEINADSDPKQFTITRADTPQLVASQPAVIDGKGSIPTDASHEYTTGDPTAENVQWTACTGALTNLDSGTYYVRVAASATVLASDAQKIELAEFVPAKEATPTAVFTAFGCSTGELSGLVSGATYTFDESKFTVEAGATSKLLTDLSTGEHTLIKNGNYETTVDSEEQKITIAKASTPVLIGTNPTEIGGNGSINTANTHEYVTEDPEDDPDLVSWNDCNGALAVGAGTYYIRVKPDGAVLASDVVMVTLADPYQEETPAATFTATGRAKGTLSGLTAGNYKISLGGEENTFVMAEGVTTHDLTGLNAGKLTLVRLGDNGATSVDSLPQEFTITKAEKPELVGVNPSNRGRKGSIPTTAIHEYRTSSPQGNPDAEAWTACTGALTNLEAGDYYIRVAPSQTMLASEVQNITLETEEIVVVTFDANGHGTAPASVEIKSGSLIPEPDAPSTAGYIFGGWYIHSDCNDEDKWAFLTTALAGDVTLYAKWTPIDYVVKFDKNLATATGNMENQAKKYDDGVALPACTFEDSESLEFAGWSLVPEGTGIIYADGAIANFAIENGATVTLYATWTEEDWGDITPADAAELKAQGIRSNRIGNGIWIGKIEDVPFTGENVTLSADELHVYDGKKLLTNGVDYTAKYSNQKNVGNAARVTVTGKGNYGFSYYKEFSIVSTSLLTVDPFVYTIKDMQYKAGTVQKSKPTVRFGRLTLKEGTDYNLTYDPEDPVDVGEVKVTVTGMNRFKNTVVLTYHIFTAETTLSNAVIELDNTYPLVYRKPGEPVCPPVKVKLNKNSDGYIPASDAETGEENYEVRFENNENVGKATVWVIGKNAYGGYKSATFKIAAKPLSWEGGASVSVTGNTSYSGSALKPAIEVFDGNVPVLATDYSVSYKNNTNRAGADETTAAGKDIAPVVTVKFKGNYSGTMTKKFAITGLQLAEEDLKITVPDVKLSKANRQITAAMIKPTVKYGKKTLKKGTDYSVAFAHSGGSVYVAMITLQGNYANKPGVEHIDKPFRTYQAQDTLSETNFAFALSTTSFTYTGDKITPAVSITAADHQYQGADLKLVEGRDFTVSYSNNVNASVNAPANKQPTIKVKGKGAYKGTLTKNFTIIPINVEDLRADEWAVTVPDVKCANRRLSPKVKVTVKGKTLKASDYSLVYGDTTAPTGNEKATVTVNFAGNYSGTKEGHFRVYQTDITKMTFEKIADQNYTGLSIRPGENDSQRFDPENEIKIYKTKQKNVADALVYGVDYTLEWEENITTGRGTVYIIGIGEYGNRKALTFKIKQKK